MKIFFSLAFSILFFLYIVPPYDNKGANYKWINFDRVTLNNLIQNNKIILLDFTADWCITCQINKKTTLQNKNLLRYLKDRKVELMRGDWTKSDDEILSFIKGYGRIGIPVNIIFGPNNRNGIVLPEILTKDLIIMEKLIQ